MSLYGSIQMAGNTLQAMQIGLHVVGNNIANANTPGYIRERTIFTPAPTQRLGTLTIGLGVEVAGIVQSLDRFVEERLRGVGSDRASADAQAKIYHDLESILGELSDTDVSTLLTNFFNSIDDVAAHPEQFALRNLAVQAGRTLTTKINSLARNVDTVYQDFGKQVQNLTTETNALTEQIRKLNLQIVALEVTPSQTSEAGGLRSQRYAALHRLSEIVDVKVNETPVGAVNISVDGELLVFEGTRREVTATVSSSNGRALTSMTFVDNGDAVRASGGELHGIYEGRDRITGGFIEKLDEFAAALAFEFNKVYSQGQGASGFTSVTSVEEVDDPNAVLDVAGLPFTPVSGVFNLLVYNTATKLTNRRQVLVDLDGLDGDMTLAQLAATLDSIDGVASQVTADNLLKISAESSELQIAFEGDTSGVLAALGINTFFTGATAATLGINQTVQSDASKFAAAQTGVGVDTQNALRLVALHDADLSSLGGLSIVGIYDSLVNDTAQGSTVAESIADGFEVFEQTLEASAQAVSGVNLDEEAIDMILLQRTYQASAKYISTLAELMDVLVSL